MDTNRNLGLVLGGGGVRGGAHIGLLKVLDREGIRVGPIAGTSAGGIVGGLYAAGLSGVEIAEFLLGCAPARLFEPDVSGWSLLSTRRFIHLIQKRVGDVRVEDLKHPFAAVAVDLTNAREVMLDSGPLATVIQATIAVPGLLPPLERGDSLLVDGGVLNNVPVDIVRRLGAGRVLAIDVGTRADLPPEVPSFAIWPGRLPNVLDHLLALTRRQRAAMAVTRSIDIVLSELTDRRLREDPPDLLLRPRLGSMQITDMSRLAEAIAIGERMAEERLDEILELADM